MMAANGKPHDVEKLSSNDDMAREDALQRVRTAGSISIPPELFEQLYLSPQNRVKGDLRKTFGNPTPVAIGGFLLALTPLSLQLLNFRGAGGNGAAAIGAYFFFGGLLMMLGGVGEWILGNTFPTTVFTTFGAFWLTYGATLQSSYGAMSSYGDNMASFYASFGMFLISMMVLCFIYMIASIRTNLVFFFIFLLIFIAFGCLSASFWADAEGQTARGLRLLHAGAGLALAVCILGWYLFLALVLAAVDFPIAIPLFDLSTIVKGASDLKKTRND